MKQIELINDHFQNFKAYGIPKAQLIIAAAQCGRRAYGFEIKKNFCAEARAKILSRIQKSLFV